MKKAAALLVDKRYIFLSLFLALAAVCLLLAGQVRVNYDLAEYLPPDSGMKQGMRLMEQEFGETPSSRLRVMLPGLSEEEKPEILARLSALNPAAEVTWEPGEEYNRDGYTLFEITTEYGSRSKEAAVLYRAVHETFGGRGAATGGDIHTANVPLLELHMVVIAVGLVLLILLIMCRSWFEPVVFLVNIGIAVAINLGTNLVFSSISEYTQSIAGIMQLVLSMDYSIILMNRFTQEKESGSASADAMKAAISAAFPAVIGSSLTTFAGLLCLAFMRFRLGADMGFALAKGVLVSLICIFTVLPSLILLSEKLIDRTRKKALHIPMGGYARFVLRRRRLFPVLFLALFAGVFFVKSNIGIQYTMPLMDPVGEVFGEKNTIVLLYETKDSEKIHEVAEYLEADEQVAEVTAYCTTLGKAWRAEEITSLLDGGAGFDPSMVRLIYADKFYSELHGEAPSLVQRYYTAQFAYDGSWAMTPAELVSWLQDHILDDPRFAGLISEEVRQQIAGAGSMIAGYAAQLEGESYGRMILTSRYPDDSEETRAFIRALSEKCENTLEGNTWLIGSSVMNMEMAGTFSRELNRITLLSAAAIFIVVALTFRSLAVPLILVLAVQCGIYMTMAFIGLSGDRMFYLAILMVQCILMGATIDYGILYTSYYRECRRREDRLSALRSAYDGSLHTILTSALIMIAAAGILGFVFANPAIGEICLTISRGAISATLIILFILPGILAALDRFVTRGSAGTEKQTGK